MRRSALHLRFALCLSALFPLAATATAQTSTPITGRVVGPAGVPITSARVFLQQQDEIVASATTDTHGHYSIAKAAGEYQVWVFSRGFRSISKKDYTFLANKTSDFVLSVGGCDQCIAVAGLPIVKLYGQVTDQAGVAVSDAFLVVNNRSVLNEEADISASENGSFSFDAPAEEYAITVLAVGYKKLSLYGVRLPGANLVLRRSNEAGQAHDSSLTGRVVDPDGRPVSMAQVSIQSRPYASINTDTDANGTYTFPAHAGTYEVTVHGRGFQAARNQKISFEKGLHPTLRLSLGSDDGGISAIRPAIMQAEFSPDTSAMLQYAAPSKPFTGASTSILEHTPWEYGPIVQSGVGVTEDRDSFKFLFVGVHAGKVLTDTIGYGALRGNFEYAVDVFPFFQSYTPVTQRNNCVSIPVPAGAIQCSAPFNIGGTFTGASITPIILRWNLIGTRRVSFWGQAAGGVLWTNHKYPAFGGPAVVPGTIVAGDIPGILQNNGPSADASVWNFTPQGGIGMHWFFKPRRSIDLGANAVHISSASLGDRNPGVNASVQFTLSTTWWK